MKRIVALTIILALNITLFAAVKAELAKPVSLQAGFGAVSEFYVSTISSQGTLYLIGMPFDIEDPIVHFQSSTTGHIIPGFVSESGRIIADWHMLFNKPVDIRIEADNLKPIATTYTGEGLSFSLIFSFTLSHTIGGNIQTAEGYIIYNGTEQSTYIYDKNHRVFYPAIATANPNNQAPFSEYLSNGLNIEDGLIGNVDGKVIFGFTREATEKIKNNPTELPDGEYRAEVRIFMEVKE